MRDASATGTKRSPAMTSQVHKPAKGDFLGHPPGLAVLFATEAWERFSYFGNGALIVLYMVKYLLEPDRAAMVLGFAAVKGALEFLFGRLDPQPFASQLFGFYTGLAYFTPILGGLLADRVLGQRRTVVIGGVLMAAGHFLMAFEALFLLALLLLILGIGAFKPNISSQVGGLYAPGDARPDRAYSIFYVGINLGAFLAPLVCGTLAVQFGWHAGFAASGVGMLISLSIYLYGSRTLPAHDPKQPKASRRERIRLDREERRTVLALCGVCALVVFFWASYDQQANTVVLWAEDHTNRSIDLRFWQGEIPATWFLALNPLFIFLFTPLLVAVWARQAERGTEPRAVSKMALGCLCVALANLILAFAAATAHDRASPLWLVGYFIVATVGELHVAPIGLALISKAAPVRRMSMMMGVWFATTLPADVLAGWLGGFWSTMGKANFFLMIAASAAFGSLGLRVVSPALTSIFSAARPRP